MMDAARTSKLSCKYSAESVPKVNTYLSSYKHHFILIGLPDDASRYRPDSPIGMG
jgi:hypothetical protein